MSLAFIATAVFGVGWILATVALVVRVEADHKRLDRLAAECMSWRSLYMEKEKEMQALRDRYDDLCVKKWQAEHDAEELGKRLMWLRTTVRVSVKVLGGLAFKNKRTELHRSKHFVALAKLVKED